MKSPKPEHKFFERFLDNDLEDLAEYLEEKNHDLVSGKIGNIPKNILDRFNNVYLGGATQLGEWYNIFEWDHPAIQKLKLSLKDSIIEACDYYGIDFEKENYHISGWFNFDYKSEGNQGVSPIKYPEHYHDHMGGEGAPVFHGYYCVNAEPSITFYKINRGDNIFENVNKNNRAVISETGHPHGRDDWYEDKPRITIAYDIAKADYTRNGIKL